MLQYIPIDKYHYSDNLIHLWNEDYGGVLPIQKSVFKSVVLNDPNLNKDASFVALYDNRPVGFIFIKTWLKDSGFANEQEKAYISLIYVKKEMRNVGIGGDMLRLAINQIKKHKTIKTLSVGNEINKLFPGVPNELSSAPIFFMNRGFTQKEGVVDMISVMKDERIEKVSESDMHVSIATEDEKEELLQLCVNNGWQREAYLINQYFEKGGTGRRIAFGTVNDKIVAIVRFEDVNKKAVKTNIFMKRKSLGNIVFSKVDMDYQNQGYEEFMNMTVKNYLIRRGCNKVIISATKDVAFFKKLGYSVYKYYLRFELPL